MPIIDFARCTVIAIFGGATWNTAGLEVVSSSIKDDEIVVDLDWCTYQTMDDGDRVTPFALLVIPRSTRPILLRYDTRGLGERVARLPPIWRPMYRFPELKPQ